jgi:hypothetical protein
LEVAMNEQQEAQAIYDWLGLTPTMLRRIGGVAVLSGNVEFWAERALWALTEENPAGVRPSTDGQPMSRIIARIAEAAQSVADPTFETLIATWAQAAAPAFQCRNTIFHGVTISFQPGSASFLTKTRWAEEERRQRGKAIKRGGDFVADDHTLQLLEEVVAVVLRGVLAIRKVAAGEAHLKGTQLLASLRRARSVANEIVDLVAAVNHEKY